LDRPADAVKTIAKIRGLHPFCHRVGLPDGFHLAGAWPTIGRYLGGFGSRIERVSAGNLEARASHA
jgi:hypothetical protein